MEPLDALFTALVWLQARLDTEDSQGRDIVFCAMETVEALKAGNDGSKPAQALLCSIKYANHMARVHHLQDIDWES